MEELIDSVLKILRAGSVRLIGDDVVDVYVEHAPCTPTASAQLTILDVSLVCFTSEPGYFSFDSKMPHLCPVFFSSSFSSSFFVIQWSHYALLS